MKYVHAITDPHFLTLNQGILSSGQACSSARERCHHWSLLHETSRLVAHTPISRPHPTLPIYNLITKAFLQDMKSKGFPSLSATPQGQLEANWRRFGDKGEVWIPGSAAGPPRLVVCGCPSAWEPPWKGHMQGGGARWNLGGATDGRPVLALVLYRGHHFLSKAMFLRAIISNP